MSKSTNLALLNKLLEKINEPVVTTMTALSGRNLLAWNSINEALREIYSYNQGRWNFNEARFTITLASATSSYTKDSALLDYDEETFIDIQNEQPVSFLEYQNFKSQYRNVTSTDTGYPTEFTERNGMFYFNRCPGTAENAKTIQFDGWSLPTLFTTATATSTCEIPELFEDDVLIKIAKWKVFLFEEDSEALALYKEIYGEGGRGIEGSLPNMKRAFSSQRLKKMRMTYVFGEGNRSRNVIRRPLNPYI